MRSHTQRVDTLLAEVRKLLDTVSLEKSALRAGDNDALGSAVAQKQEQLAALAAHLDEVNLPEPLSEDSEQLAELRGLLQRLRDENLTNGYQIVLHRQFAQEALAALRGEDPGAGVYGVDAKLPGAHTARAVAKA